MSREKWIVLCGCYVAVIVFFISLIVINKLEITDDRDLLYAATIASPLILIIFWDRLTSIKAPWFEIGLSEVAVEIDIVSAHQIQDAVRVRAPTSKTQDISWAITQIGKISAGSIVEVNLADGEYWWPTRLYLFAALADDYADVPMIAFVQSGRERKFVGMATPSATRRAIASFFTPGDYESKYRDARSQSDAFNVTKPMNERISAICRHWGPTFEQGEGDSFPMKVNSTLLREMLDGNLVEQYAQWEGRVTKLLMLKIFYCGVDYMPLVQDGRLEKVAGRQELAVRITDTMLRRQIG